MRRGRNNVTRKLITAFPANQACRTAHEGFLIGQLPNPDCKGYHEHVTRKGRGEDADDLAGAQVALRSLMD
jgi:hypothetical protein